MQRALDAINEMNANTPPPPALSRESCHIKENSEIDGRVVKWGADHFTVSPKAQRCAVESSWAVAVCPPNSRPSYGVPSASCPAASPGPPHRKCEISTHRNPSAALPSVFRTKHLHTQTHTASHPSQWPAPAGDAHGLLLRLHQPPRLQRVGVVRQPSGVRQRPAAQGVLAKKEHGEEHHRQRGVRAPRWVSAGGVRGEGLRCRTCDSHGALGFGRSRQDCMLGWAP